MDNCGHAGTQPNPHLYSYTHGMLIVFVSTSLVSPILPGRPYFASGAHRAALSSIIVVDWEFSWAQAITN